jgi:trigger factor
LEANEIPLPNVLIESEVWRLGVESGAIDEKAAEARAPIDPELSTRLRPAAERRVALGLIVSEIVRRNELAVEETRIAAQIDSVASTYEQPEQVRAWYRGNEKAMESVRNSAMEEQFLDWVLEHSKVEDKSMSFDEVVNTEGKT